MDNLSDDCLLFQDAQTVEVADAPSMSIVEEYQLLGYSSPAAISTTHSEVEPSLSVGEDQGRCGVSALSEWSSLQEIQKAQGVSHDLARKQALNPKER